MQLRLVSIIEPLASRCSKFRFRALDIGSTEERLRFIADKEGVAREDGVRLPFSSPALGSVWWELTFVVFPSNHATQVIELLIKLSAGDLRRAITLLQSASRLHAAEQPPSAITCESVQEMSGIVPTTLVTQLLSSVGVDEEAGYLGSDFKGSFEQTQKAVKRVKREGWSAGTVLSQVRVLHAARRVWLIVGRWQRPVRSPCSGQMHDALVAHPSIPSKPKSLAAQAMAECDKALCEGGDEELQLLDCLLKVKKAMVGGAWGGARRARPPSLPAALCCTMLAY
jgi:replication factor C subunit 2/4